MLNQKSKKLLLFKLFFVLSAFKVCAGSRPDITDTLTLKSGNLLFINAYDIRYQRYDSFSSLLDTNYFFSKSNVFSRLKAINISTGKILFNIGMIPAVKLVFHSNRIVCLSNLLIRGLPQIVVVNMEGKIEAIEALPFAYSSHKKDSFNTLKQKYPMQIKLLYQIDAIHKSKNHININLDKLIMLGNCRFLSEMEDELTQKDSTFINDEIHSTISSAMRLYWFSENNPYFKLKTKKGRIKYMIFKDHSCYKRRIKFSNYVPG